MVLSGLIWAGIKAFVVALVLTPIVRDIFRAYNVVDRPGHRKVHAYPIPRVGGGPIAAAYAITLFALLDIKSPLPGHAEALKLLPGAAIIFLTGLLDDFLDLRPALKLVGQIAAAGVVFANGLRIDTVGGIQVPLWLSLPATVLWLLLTTNALNLIDGLDGLCAGIGFLAAMTLFVVGVIRDIPPLMYTTLPLAGALFGFVFFNFSPATVFLGDSGALTIGFLLGCAGLIWTKYTHAPIDAVVPLLALSVPLMDVSLSIVRRFLKKQPIFSADRGHIHHRMLDHALTPRRAALSLYLMALPGAAAAILLSYQIPAIYHVVALMAFCLFAGGGIRQLRYAEFEMARGLFFGGEFRRVLAGKVRVEQLGTALRYAKSEDEWWKTLVSLCRQEGWIRLTWTRSEAPREQTLSARTPAWSFHIELNDEESVFIEGDLHAAHPSIDLVDFSAVLRRTFPANRREWEQPALS